MIGKNGDGKSTILDALCFSLFGRAFRNINKNQMINSINGKNTLVEIEFTIGTNRYKIVRGIKPNIFEIWLNDEMINQDAASKDYQKILEQQILKLNYKTFTQVVILGSASFVPFMQLSSGQRRDVIEDILDIGIFSAMNQLLKDKQNTNKDEINRIESEISLSKQLVRSQSDIIKRISTAKQDNINVIVNKIESNNQKLNETNIKITEISNEINELKNETKLKSELDKDIKSTNHIKSKLINKIEEQIDSKFFFEKNDICPACSQNIVEDHKHRVVAETKRKIEETNLKILELDSILLAYSKACKKINNIISTITDKTIELSTYNSAVTILNKHVADMYQEIRTTESDTKDIIGEKIKLKLLAENALSAINRKTELSVEKEVHDTASSLLKDTGIKTAIIREYLPVMNKLINQYLNQLDSYIHFELDDSFVEHIKSRFRDDFTYASFSEGEKSRIDLAILFTWRQIAKMKNSVNTNLLLLDEIFDSSLDVNGTEYFLNLMNTLGEHSNVFVISHKSDTLFDKFKNVIKFEKRNDFSVILKN